jgi:hypothetical protein
MRKKKVWERMIPLSKADRRFDIEFWQAQSSTLRFRATFDMLQHPYKMKGKRVNADTFRLQRSIETLKQA